MLGLRGKARRPLVHRDEMAMPIRGRASAVIEQVAPCREVACAHRPLHRFERVVGRVVEMRETADIETAAAVVFECRKRRMFAKDIGRAPIGKVFGKAEPMRDRGHDRPIAARLSGRTAEGTLARNPPLRIGDGAVLFAPAGGRQKHMRPFRGIRLGHAIGDDNKRTAGERAPHFAGIRHADGRIGSHDPERLDRPSATASKRSTAVRPGRRAIWGAFQKRRTRSSAAGSSKFIWAAS